VNEPLSLAVDYLMAGSQQDFPVMQDGSPVGVLTRDQLLAAIARHGASVPVSQVVLRPMLPLDPDTPLESALARMRETGQAAVPVAESGRLVGLLTSDNVGDLLLVRQALRRYMSNAAT
jgi:CBS domain-containing protein